MAKHRTRYSSDFKERAVHKVLTDGIILTRTASELGIPKSVLSKWVTRVKKTRAPVPQDVFLVDGIHDGLGGTDQNTADIAVLEDRIKRLEGSLEALRRILETAYATKVQLQFPADMPAVR